MVANLVPKKAAIEMSNLAILWASLAAWHLHLWSHVEWLLWSDTNIASLEVIVKKKNSTFMES